MDVVYAGGGFQAVDASDIARLEYRAEHSPKKRSRLCLHDSPESGQHAMLILVMAPSYIRPHKHLTRDETFMLVEGECDVLLFGEDGQVQRVIEMAAPGSQAPYFYVMPRGQFHGLVVRSSQVVFIETTIGPFDPQSSVLAPWSPSESSGPAGIAWLVRQAAIGRDAVP